MNSCRSILAIATLVVLVAVGEIVLVRRTNGQDTTQPAVTKTAGTLVIRKAMYGDLPDGTTVDVTDKVRARVKDGALSVAATDGNFGDPYNGTMKLTIIKAELRHGPFVMADITDEISKQPADNSFHMTSRGVMKLVVYYSWGDGKERFAWPARDGSVDIVVPRKLRVDYTVNGVDASTTVDSGQRLEVNANDAIVPPLDVAGTVWASSESSLDDYDYHFHADGTLEAISSSGADKYSGTWKQDGDSISFEAGSVKYRGTIFGNRMEGSAHGLDDFSWYADKK
jgi:hypothetical protein